MQKDKKQKNYVGFSFTQSWLRPPMWFLFSASAERHDLMYSQGGDRMDRLTADVGFLWRMLSDANQQETFSKKKLASYTAILYFIAVRLFGWISFNYKKHGK